MLASSHSDSSSPDLVDQFAELFQGCNDAYGSNTGGCIRKPVTREVWERHLSGGEPIGIYPLVTSYPHHPLIQPIVRWGCSDIDVDDVTLALNLYRALRELGLTSWIERSRSKGYHVWVFVTEWVPAETMRNALLVAHQVAGVPPTEINPKQTGGVELGNYVRLPFPGHLHHPTWTHDEPQTARRQDAPNHPYPLASFVADALATRNTPSAIAEVAKLYVPPPPKRTVQVAPHPTMGGKFLQKSTDKLSPLAYTIYSEGPTERFGYDRSRTLQRLAHLCRESGLSAFESYEVVRAADEKWGKFYNRPDCHHQIERMIQRAYG
jgi:hypothetical protein